MKVIWRQTDKDWEIAFGKAYRDEAQLQSFLAEYPAMIPFEDISDQILQPKVMLREVGLPGSGSTDIVGVDEEGGISILECKLAANPEVKRKVIGQVVEYAAFLWRKPYDFLDAVSKRRLGKPLAAAMRDVLDEETLHDWAEPAFVQAVTDSLLEGKFRMVIAVDSINDDLRQTIEYLTEGPSRLELYALELTYFASGEREIVVPHLHGALAPSRPLRPSGTSSAWDVDRFFADVEARNLPEAEQGCIHELLAFCDDAATRTWWGHGMDTGSFTFHVLNEGRAFSVFSVFSDGRIQFNFGWLRDKVAPEVLARYRDGLKAIPTLRSLAVREDFNNWPKVRISKAFVEDSQLQAFKDLVVETRDRVLAAQ
jgi:hypothetical protein